MSDWGQNRKTSMRAYVFRFAPESGHCATQSACPFRARNGLMHRSKHRYLITSLAHDRLFSGVVYLAYNFTDSVRLLVINPVRGVTARSLIKNVQQVRTLLFAVNAVAYILPISREVAQRQSWNSRRCVITATPGSRRAWPGSAPGCACASLRPAPIRRAGRTGPRRRAYPSRSDAANRWPTPSARALP